MGEAAAPNPDLSTFELRWAEALGPPECAKVKEFKKMGGNVDKLSEVNCASLLNPFLSKDPHEPERLSFLDVGNMLFHSLEKVGKYMFVRPVYESLYDQIKESWSTERDNRVLLQGNAGTGKSWFQLYALRRLLQGYQIEHSYLFVILQVKERLFLIDLSDAQIRYFDVRQTLETFCLDLFSRRRVLYFFEPSNDRLIRPLPVHLSSLTTLSSFHERVHEYCKDRISVMMFPCWTLDELSVAAQHDPDIEIELEEVANRFGQFGGTIRHVFASEKGLAYFRKEQTKRILDADLNVLRAIDPGIDSDPEAEGVNVSGYLLSYCNIPTAGPDRFSSAELDFTSDLVKSEIRLRMKAYSIQERIEFVVDHLNGEQTDRGGLHLLEVVSFLLAQGSAVAWQCKKVADAGGNGSTWSSFTTCKREVVECYIIFEQLGAPNKVLVSTNPNFSLVDIALTNPRPIQFLNTFHVTWQLSHPFTVRNLYIVREISLEIADDVLLQVYFVAPEKEEIYAAKSKQSFLKGDVNLNLPFDKNTSISFVRLQKMWQHTEIWVLKPASSWTSTLLPYRGEKCRYFC